MDGSVLEQCQDLGRIAPQDQARGWGESVKGKLKAAIRAVGDLQAESLRQPRFLHSGKIKNHTVPTAISYLPTGNRRQRFLLGPDAGTHGGMEEKAGCLFRRKAPGSVSRFFFWQAGRRSDHLGWCAPKAPSEASGAGSRKTCVSLRFLLRLAASIIKYKGSGRGGAA